MYPSISGAWPVATFAYDVKIARVQRTLRWLEEDASLLSLRVRDLSPERQKVAKTFAASMINQTRAELDRLMQERTQETDEQDAPCEPAD
jgi:hypothetical protein